MHIYCIMLRTTALLFVSAIQLKINNNATRSSTAFLNSLMSYFVFTVHNVCTNLEKLLTIDL